MDSLWMPMDSYGFLWIPMDSSASQPAGRPASQTASLTPKRVKMENELFIYANLTSGGKVAQDCDFY